MAESSALTSITSCAVCCQAISLPTTGLVRTHGPVQSRCTGSRQPPATRVPSSSQMLIQIRHMSKFQQEIETRQITVMEKQGRKGLADTSLPSAGASARLHMKLGVRLVAQHTLYMNARGHYQNSVLLGCIARRKREGTPVSI